MRRTDVLVVGAGIAGVRTVQALRRAGFARRLTIVGAEPHEPYDRPPLSKECLVGTHDIRLLGADWDGLAAEAILGHGARRVDVESHAVDLDDGTTLTYRTLVIATGATPRRITGAPAGLHVLRSIDDMARLRTELTADHRIAVIGAGFIGCEVASAARVLGLPTVLVDALPAPLAGTLGPVLASTIAELHREHEVDLRCGAGVAGIVDAGLWHLHLSDGSAVEADTVVEAIGVQPDCTWLAGSGIDIGDGVLCDEFGATSAPDVWAAGDVAAWWDPGQHKHVRFEHWTNAVEQGAALAHNIVAAPAERRPLDSVPYFWSDQYGIKIQRLGCPAPSDELHVIAEEASTRRLLALYARDGIVTGVVGLNRPRDVMRLRSCLKMPTKLADAAAAAAA